MIRSFYSLLMGGVLSITVALPSAHAVTTPDFATVRSDYTTTEGRLVDRAGEPLSERRVVFEGRRLEWVPLDQLSPAVLEALLEARMAQLLRALELLSGGQDGEGCAVFGCGPDPSR